MKLSVAISWIRAAKRHIDEDATYRWWAVYAACLVTFMNWTARWPWNWENLAVAYQLYPRVMASLNLPCEAAVYLVWCLAVVALVRGNWAGRCLALYSLNTLHYFKTDRYWDPIGWLWGEFTWYAFDLPGRWIHGYAGEGTALSTCLWFVYMVGVWVALRPLAMRAYPALRWLSGRIVEAWPLGRGLARPIFQQPEVER